MVLRKFNGILAPAAGLGLLNSVCPTAAEAVAEAVAETAAETAAEAVAEAVGPASSPSSPSAYTGSKYI